MKLATLFVLALVLSAVALDRYPHPWAWILPTFSVVLALSAWQSRGRVRFVFLNLAAVVATLAAVELAWQLPSLGGQSPGRAGSTRSGPYYRTLPVLGYAGAKGASVSETATFEEEKIYDVVYTTDENGLRISAPRSGREEASVLFFGCSFTFGWGVQDQETLPYRTGVLSAGRYAVSNFGVIGYGPHHALATIEQGLVEAAVEVRPRYAVYSLIGDHILRVMGWGPWNNVSPRYALSDAGGVVYQGPFESTPPPAPRNFVEGVTRQLARSAVVSRVAPTLGQQLEIDLLVEILAQAGRRLEELYPGLEFHVLVWDPNDRRINRASRALRARGLRVHLVSEALPGYAKDADRFHIPHDGHPTARAYDGLARYLTAEVLTDR